MMLHFSEALLPGGWRRDVRISVAGGVIVALDCDVPAQAGDERFAVGVPGMANLHSHTFQRGMAGLAKRRSAVAESFWSWREVMYRFVGLLTPEDVAAVAGLAFMEMLEAGFTRVGEFHYLHHAPGGVRYARQGEMAERIVEAAVVSGIGLTLLPVFYAHGGFGGVAPGAGQARFVHDLDGFARLHEVAGEALRALPDGVLGVAPHSLRAVTEGELAACVGLAGGGPVHIHVAEQEREVAECLAFHGERPVEWLLQRGMGDGWCAVHATHMTPAETAGLAASGAVAGLCPLTEANLGDGIFEGAAYRAAGGRFGVGTDSNIRISLAGELEMLEYSQRLGLRGRNLMAAPGESAGRALFEGALLGGAAALGVASGLRVGGAADVVALDGAHPSMVGRAADGWLDGFVFAGAGAVDTVWRWGVKLVQGGRHVGREGIVAAYRARMGRLLAG